jgi:hypothetical protein
MALPCVKVFSHILIQTLVLIMDIIRYIDLNATLLESLLRPYGMRLREVQEDAEIPGSYWGESEAGLVGDDLFVRSDTPLHSLMHEACHYICMDGQRRQQLHTDAGGEFVEENAVCYLQILLADTIVDQGAQRMMQDMDAWGYTFRLGSAKAWFEQDADDAQAWLQDKGIIDQQGQPTGQRCP